MLEHMVDPKQQIHDLLAAVNKDGNLMLTLPDGRKDAHQALEERDDGTGCWGHIKLWSPLGCCTCTEVFRF